MDDKILQIRNRIDEIDAQVLALISERARCAHEIGTLKGESAVYRPEREAQVLRRLMDLNAGPLPGSAVQHLFTEIISACRALEKTMRVAFLGPQGTYSEEAARKQFGSSAESEPCASIGEVFRRVEAGFAGYGVVPVENSTEGGVGVTLDLLQETTLRICAEVVLPIHHCLMGKGADMAALRVVYAHAQALAQCNEWLSRHLPNAQRVPVASNAEAARRAGAEPGTAAIASRAAAEIYALDLLAENIEDEPSNTTRFLVIGRQEVGPSGRDKTSIAMGAANRPGGLHTLLGPLARHDVSLSRLESRPSRQGLWEYTFFLDLEGHQRDASVAAALSELRESAAFLKILGSYPVAPA
jgi:chorismate mutase/prephenate dehydratase